MNAETAADELDTAPEAAGDDDVTADDASLEDLQEKLEDLGRRVDSEDVADLFEIVLPGGISDGERGLLNPVLTKEFDHQWVKSAFETLLNKSEVLGENEIIGLFMKAVQERVGGDDETYQGLRDIAKKAGNEAARTAVKVQIKGARELADELDGALGSPLDFGDMEQIFVAANDDGVSTLEASLLGLVASASFAHAGVKHAFDVLLLGGLFTLDDVKTMVKGASAAGALTTNAVRDLEDLVKRYGSIEAKAKLLEVVQSQPTLDRIGVLTGAQLQVSDLTALFDLADRNSGLNPTEVGALEAFVKDASYAHDAARDAAKLLLERRKLKIDLAPTDVQTILAGAAKEDATTFERVVTDVTALVDRYGNKDAEKLLPEHIRDARLAHKLETLAASSGKVTVESLTEIFGLVAADKVISPAEKAILALVGARAEAFRDAAVQSVFNAFANDAAISIAEVDTIVVALIGTETLEGYREAIDLLIELHGATGAIDHYEKQVYPPEIQVLKAELRRVGRGALDLGEVQSLFVLAYGDGAIGDWERQILEAALAARKSDPLPTAAFNLLLGGQLDVARVKQLLQKASDLKLLESSRVALEQMILALGNEEAKQMMAELFDAQRLSAFIARYGTTSSLDAEDVADIFARAKATLGITPSEKALLDTFWTQLESANRFDDPAVRLGFAGLLDDGVLDLDELKALLVEAVKLAEFDRAGYLELVEVGGTPAPAVALVDNAYLEQSLRVMSISAGRIQSTNLQPLFNYVLRDNAISGDERTILNKYAATAGNFADAAVQSLFKAFINDARFDATELGQFVSAANAAGRLATYRRSLDGLIVRFAISDEALAVYDSLAYPADVVPLVQRVRQISGGIGLTTMADLFAQVFNDGLVSNTERAYLATAVQDHPPGQLTQDLYTRLLNGRLSLDGLKAVLAKASQLGLMGSVRTDLGYVVDSVGSTEAQTNYEDLFDAQLLTDILAGVTGTVDLAEVQAIFAQAAGNGFSGFEEKILTDFQGTATFSNDVVATAYGLLLERKGAALTTADADDLLADAVALDDAGFEAAVAEITTLIQTIGNNDAKAKIAARVEYARLSHTLQPSRLLGAAELQQVFAQVRKLGFTAEVKALLAGVSSASFGSDPVAEAIFEALKADNALAIADIDAIGLAAWQGRTALDGYQVLLDELLTNNGQPGAAEELARMKALVGAMVPWAGAGVSVSLAGVKAIYEQAWSDGRLIATEQTMLDEFNLAVLFESDLAEKAAQTLRSGQTLDLIEARDIAGNARTLDDTLYNEADLQALLERFGDQVVKENVSQLLSEVRLERRLYRLSGGIGLDQLGSVFSVVYEDDSYTERERQILATAEPKDSLTSLILERFKVRAVLMVAPRPGEQLADVQAIFDEWTAGIGSAEQKEVQKQYIRSLLSSYGQRAADGSSAALTEFDRLTAPPLAPEPTPAPTPVV
jgi:hypothetical protein